MNSKPARQQAYNCKKCRAGKDIESRICYWFDGEGEGEEKEVPVALDAETEEKYVIFKKNDVLNLTAEGVIGALGEIRDVHSQYSSLELCRIFFPRVCPKSLITKEVDELLVMESFCKEYHMLPIPNVSYFDLPVVVRDVFVQIATTRDRVNAKELREVGQKNERSPKA
jgi:hypothetical protein